MPNACCILCLYNLQHMLARLPVTDRQCHIVVLKNQHVIYTCLRVD